MNRTHRNVLGDVARRLGCTVVLVYGASAGGRAVAEETRLDVRWSPIVDLHFLARNIEADLKADRPIAMRPLLDAVRRVNAVLGNDALSWGVLEGNLYECQTAQDVFTRFSELPERFVPRGRGGAGGKEAAEIQLRSTGMDLAQAMIKVEGQYLVAVAPKNEQLVMEALRSFTERLGANESKCLSYMIEHLGGQDPGSPIPVYFVADMMFPGAVTQIRPGRVGGVCFVAVRGIEPLQLVETVLHESTHALDVVWGEDSVFHELRTKLSAVLPTGSRDLHDVPHTLMFVHAGETVRRIVDPGHRHYGDVSGYYARLGRATKAVRQPWVDYLDGKISREAAVSQMVEAVRPNAP